MIPGLSSDKTCNSVDYGTAIKLAVLNIKLISLVHRTVSRDLKHKVVRMKEKSSDSTRPIGGNCYWTMAKRVISLGY